MTPLFAKEKTDDSLHDPSKEIIGSDWSLRYKAEALLHEVPVQPLLPKVLAIA